MDLVLTTLAILLLPIILYWLIPHLRIRFLINQIPGPTMIPFLGNILDFQKPMEDLLTDFNKRAVQFKNDKIYKIWMFTRPSVIFFSPEAMEVLMTNNTNISKPVMYQFMEVWLGQGLITSAGEKWRFRRKLITPAFHFQIINEFIPIFCDHSETLVKTFQKHINKEAFDPYPYLTLCTMDIISETAMGVKIDAQLNKDSEYVKAVKIVGHLLENRNRKPWQWSDFLFKYFGPGKILEKNLNIIHTFTQKVIEDRAEDINKGPKTPDAKPDDIFFAKKKKRAFLDLLLHASDNGKVLSFSDIQEEVDTFMFAGHDTTSATSLFAIYLFGRNPEIQKKAQQELDDIFGSDNRQPTIDDLKNMKYLECCLKEVLRMYPAASHIGRHITKDMKVLNYTIPKGVDVIVDIYSLHHNTDSFPNPEKFDPDRFLPENTEGRHPFAYIPFSAGTRNCIGQKFALMEEKVILSYILRNFNIEAMQTQEELKLLVMLVLRSGAGMLVKLTERKK